MVIHSRWAPEKKRKGVSDAKQAKIFSKLMKEISLVSKEGGDDPALNARLRLATNNAKGAGMPGNLIEQAIFNGIADDAKTYTKATYEGYAAHGVAVFVETMTDNLNRTVNSLRTSFATHGGSLETSGSLEFIFDRKGVFNILVPQGKDVDELTLALIDAGVEEVEIVADFMELSCAMQDFNALQEKMEALDIAPVYAGLHRVPRVLVALEDEAFKAVYKLIKVLEALEDVHRVYHNIDATERQMEFI